MPRRWSTAITAVALAVAALACEGSGPGEPSPDPSRSRPARSASMAALGDSITTGYGSCVALVSCPRNSWSTGTGTRVNSLYERLADTDADRRLTAHNEAAPGSRVAALPDQASGAVRHKADYVTVLIGANDACRPTIQEMTSVATFRAELTQAFQVLRKGRPKARVLVVSIPDLHRLWEVGRTDRLAVRVWSHGVCPALLANPTSTATVDVRRRAAFAARIDAYNRELAAACERYGPRCTYDGGAAHRIPVTLDKVNPLDFFHPDADGQNALAAAAWAAWRRAL
ncbi:GDSL-type esterase/lipase family protein [Plantactinospora sp. GCM10030261]|uniref:GDSL-type esterase/lipase family protein n=1 Tax=Plantactinospora sp. GCM10030261 TaxID=3273420 RepID=UPI0036231F9A